MVEYQLRMVNLSFGKPRADGVEITRESLYCFHVNTSVTKSTGIRHGVYPLDGRDLAEVTDRELFDTYHSAILFSHGANRSIRLSITLVLKGNVLPSEGENMKFAAAHTRILMPQCHRIFYFRPDRQIQHRRFFRDVKIVKWLAHYLHHNPFRRVPRNEIGGNEQFEENDDSDIDDNNESNEGGSDQFKSEGG